MRSLSLSGSGHPSASWNPSLSSGLVGALVVVVGDPVAIVVGIGAAVEVLEPVLVLRLVGALVDVVLDAVAVAVADVGLEHDADERADVGVGRLAAAEPRPTAEEEVGVARQVELDRAQDLERLVVRRVERHRAEHLGDEVELLRRDGKGDRRAPGDLVLHHHRLARERHGRGRPDHAAVGERMDVAAELEADVAGEAHPPELLVQDQAEARIDLVVA
jgi:hypothetical protein